MIENIKVLSKQLFEEIRGIRRHLHQYPELSLKEYKTAEYICKVLNEEGIPYTSGIAQTGIVAILKGEIPSDKVLALRADMDALPIDEQNDVDYKSANKGVMHACGHDMHMASLIGAAKILHRLKNKWGGTIKLIFQPSEESFPGGASLLIKEGVLKNPEPLGIFGQHVAPQIKTGKVGIRNGMYMASADEIYLTIKGTGGHAATPHLVNDTVLIASHIVVALQQIVSRNAKPWIPSVLSFGRMIANGRMNVIPSEVTIDGTFRTFDEQWRKEVHQKIRSMASLTAKGMGAECEVRIEKGYPFLSNDDQMADHFRKCAIKYLGKENTEELDLSMTAEDFAFYSHEIPACFYRLGVCNATNKTTNVHTATFLPDENALQTGMGLMAWVAVKKLNPDF